MPFITSYSFQGLSNTICFFYPSTTIDYSLSIKITNIIRDIVNKTALFGLLFVDFIYSRGEIYVQKIGFNQKPEMLFFYEKFGIIYNTVLKNILYLMSNFSVIGKNTDINHEKQPCFFQKICFQDFDKQVLLLEDLTKEKVFSKYRKLCKK